MGAEDLNLNSLVEEAREHGLETRVSAIFESRQFLNYLREWPEDLRGYVIGRVVEYYIIHPDGYHLETFLERMKGRADTHVTGGIKVEDIFVRSIAAKLNLAEIESDDAKRMIFDYFSRRWNYVFHGFNSVFEGSIRQHGLSPEVRVWDESDMEEMALIGERYQIPMMLGWHNLSSGGKNISYSDGSQNTYSYAIRSPEWFSEFIANGGRGTIEAATAFSRRDYATARQNIERFLKEVWPGGEFSEEDKGKVRAFFEKYWGIFARPECGPRVALIKRSALGRGGGAAPSYEELRDGVFQKRAFDAADLIQVLKEGYGVDMQTKRAISPENLIIIKLPEQQKVFD